MLVCLSVLLPARVLNQRPPFALSGIAAPVWLLRLLAPLLTLERDRRYADGKGRQPGASTQLGSAFPSGLARTGVFPRLAVDAALCIGGQMTLAQGPVRRQNVVHRDIKPANTMFEPATQSVKLTDFGIARTTDPYPRAASDRSLRSGPLQGSADILIGRSGATPRARLRAAGEPASMLRHDRPAQTTTPGSPLSPDLLPPGHRTHAAPP